MPIFEYETEEKEPCEGLAVIIEVESHQRDIGGESLFSGDTEACDCGDMEEEATPYGQDGGVYTLVSEGTLSVQDGLMQLTYVETIGEEEDAAPTKVCIAFPKESGSHVTVSRSGDMNTVFSVEPGVRQYSTYETPFGQVDLCVIGKKVENHIGETGGTLRLEYAVELRGMTTQRTKMMIRVRPENRETQS